MLFEDIEAQIAEVEVKDSKHVLLEFLSAVGERRPQDTAKKLIEECGSATAVFGAPRHRLQRALGAGSPIFLALRAARRLSLNTFEERAARRPLLRSRKALLQYLGLAMAQDDRESVRILFTDVKVRLIKAEVVHQGSRTRCDVDPRYILRRALELDASGMILVHNHPSGDPTPSAEDLRITSRLASLCRELDVHLLDHIVVGLGGARSVIFQRD